MQELGASAPEGATTFIEPLDPQQAPDEIRAVLEESPDLSLLGVLAQAQGTFTPWIGFATALLSALELSPRLRELAILQVALLDRGGDYEWSQHAPLALAAGASAAQLQALQRGERSTSAFNDEEAMVLRFTREVVCDGCASAEARARLLELLGNRQVVELLQVIGQYMMVARIAATAGLRPEPPARLVARQAGLAPVQDADEETP
jgi:alkylhydroperoxidase family enzyme